VRGNDKLTILAALISSNNKVWGEFCMHPLKTNMRLATAVAAQAHGGILSQEEEEQLRYAEMLMGPRGASLPIDKQAPRGALLRSDLAWSGKRCDTYSYIISTRFRKLSRCPCRLRYGST